MLAFRFSPSKFLLQLLVLQNNFIFTFDISYKVNSYVEFIFLNKNLHKNLQYYKGLFQKHEFNMNFYMSNAMYLEEFYHDFLSKYRLPNQILA